MAVASPLHQRWWYPRYQRLAQELAVDVTKDTEIQYIRNSSDELLVITDPGNPLDPEPTDTLLLNHRPGMRIIVDAAYDNPFDEVFSEKVRLRSSFGVPTLFSLSKYAAVAGTRIGGILFPQGSQEVPPTDTRHWDAFSLSVLTALGTLVGATAVKDAALRRMLLAERIQNVLWSCGFPSHHQDLYFS